jgi:hypothetical protein
MWANIRFRPRRKYLTHKGLTAIAGWMCGTNLLCGATNIS